MNRQERRRRALLASPQAWLASALETVLASGDAPFTLTHAATPQHLDRELDADPPPDILILDGSLEAGARRLIYERVASSPKLGALPILLWAPAIWQAEVRDEPPPGLVWDVVQEPLGTAAIVEKLEELLRTGSLARMTGDAPASPRDVHVARRPEFLCFARALGGVASRERRPLGCLVLAPAERDAAIVFDAESILSVIRPHVRASDVSTSLEGTDLALLAYGADEEGLRAMATRLQEAWGRSGAGRALSIGLAPVGAGSERAADRRPAPSDADSLLTLAAAAQAMERTRATGGGVRMAGENG